MGIFGKLNFPLVASNFRDGVSEICEVSEDKDNIFVFSNFLFKSKRDSWKRSPYIEYQLSREFPRLMILS
jgi:hypothetical protein